MKGSGKLMDVDEIVTNLNLFYAPKLLSGVKVIITAGPSVERIDPIRFISNFSTGHQGYEIAKSISDYGANTILISGPTFLDRPENTKKIDVMSGDDFYEKISY